MQLHRGVTIGRYIIEEHVGSGGMGEVYRARDPRLNRFVAIKILAPELATDRAAIERFEREATAASALNHPHIMHVYDVGQDMVDGRTLSYIAMEFIDGVTLRTAMTQHRDLNETLRHLIEIGEALSKAHAAGIVHRDLKPDNVMLTSDGYIKVLDFGLAKLVASDGAADDATAALPPRTTAGTIVGTAGYMAPEQAAGSSVDHRTDIFAFGCVMYEVLSGKPAFRGESRIDTLHNVLYAEPVYDPVPVPLQAIVKRSLAKKPADRYPSMADVVADLRRLMSGRSPAAKAAPNKKAIESIAVLPFVNASDAHEAEYLSDGIAETLINSLAHIPKLRVVPRSTVFRYKNHDDVAAVAAALGVRSVLTGRVALRGNRIIVAAELTDTVLDAQVWGDQYNRPVADLLDVQRAIAEEIAEQLRPKLSGHARRRVAKIHTEDPEAYQSYLKGRYYLNKRSPDALEKSIRFFQEAIDRDPAYARGYAGLADAWLLSGWYSVAPPREVFPRALAAARKAVSIDPLFAEAHTSAAYALFLSEWDVPNAEREFEHALSLNPDYAIAHHWYADLLQATGRASVALKHAQRACAIDPLALILNAEVGRAYYYLRDFDAAIQQQKKTLELEPRFAPSHLFLGQAYDQSGRLEDAVAAFRAAANFSNESAITLGFLGYALGRAGQVDDAREKLQRLQDMAQSRWVPAFARALVHYGAGDIDAATEWLRRAREQRSHWLLYLPVDPAFDAIRDIA